MQSFRRPLRKGGYDYNSIHSFPPPGDRAGAERLSAEALRLNKIGLGVGILCTLLYVGAVTAYMLFVLGYFY